MERNTNQHPLKECKYCHKELSKHHRKSCFLNNGRYKFVKQLSRTLQGYIILAKDLTKNSQHIVIKSAYRYLVESGVSYKNHKIMENFLHERDTIKTFSQMTDFPRKGIVQWLDSWDDTKSHYYAMKLYRMSLFDYASNHFESRNRVKKRCSSTKWIKRVQTIFKRLSRSINWLHRKGFCHLDLSIENCMIDPETLEVSVIDLGTVKESSDAQFLFKGMVGKIEIMSPEVYSNVMQYDGRLADVYSLGSILYTLLFGRRPYGPTKSNSFLIKPPTAKNITGFRMFLDEYKTVMVDEIGLKALDLLQSIFRFESTRASLSVVLCHPFVKESKHMSKRDNELISHYAFANILENVMLNKSVDIMRIFREDLSISDRDLFCKFIAECVAKESLNIIEPQRIISLYRMIDKLYANDVISLQQINVYFEHLLDVKYWMKMIRMQSFNKTPFSILSCLCDYGREEEHEAVVSFKSTLRTVCKRVFYHEIKQKRYKRMIQYIGDLFICNLISWNVVLNEFIYDLFRSTDTIEAGFELLKIISLCSNNEYHKEINMFVEQTVNQCNGKTLIVMIKMKKNYITYQNAIYSARLPPPGFGLAKKSAKYRKNNDNYKYPPGLTSFHC